MDLTPEIIFGLLQSKDQFPVDFDDAMVWWDAKTRNATPVRRDNLIRTLKAEFFEETDFTVLKFEDGRNPDGTFDADKYYLTIDCFKSFGMMIPGKRGREIRGYFIRCEQELKRRIEEEKRDIKGRLVRAFVSEGVVSRRSRFKPEFYELIYRKRGKGWEKRDPNDQSRPSCVGTWTNQLVYDRFPSGVKERLNEVNPRINGRRKDKHHEHFKPMGSDYLDSHLPAVMAIARLSPDGNWDKFMRNIQKGLPNGEPLQIDLLDLLEEYEGLDEAS